MLKFNEIFSDDIKKLRESIDNITVENCIKKYSYYIDVNQSSINNAFEKDFIDLLNKRSHKFLLNIIKKRYNSFSKKELIDIAMEKVEFGSTSLADDIYDNGFYEVFSSYFKDADVYEDIKAEIKEAFDNIVESKMTKTPTTKEIRLKKITELKKMICIENSKLENFKKELQQFEEEEKNDEC